MCGVDMKREGQSIGVKRLLAIQGWQAKTVPINVGILAFFPVRYFHV